MCQQGEQLGVGVVELQDHRRAEAAQDGGHQLRIQPGEGGDTLLPASATENLDIQPAVREEDEELDADKVFAKLSSLKGRNTDEDEEE